MILLSSIPILLTMFLLHKQALSAFSQVGDNLQLAQNNREHLSLLKKMKQYDPTNEGHYREQFNQLVETQWVLDDWQQVRNLFMGQLAINSLIISGIVLLLAMIFSYYFARNIVDKYSRLLASNQAQMEKLKGLEYLKQWQQTARMLAHELKTPMTPMRLISTELYRKYETLPPEKFRSYLQQTSELLCSQVTSMDELVQNLLAFGKFPVPQLRPITATKIFTEFIDRYQKLIETNKVLFAFPKSDSAVQLEIDLNQIIHLLYNLVTNAMEANKGQRITITFSQHLLLNHLLITIANNGKLIANSDVEKIFQPNFSQKGQIASANNLGLGLTIAKKVALDHGGDLQLLANDPQQGVVFGLELPIKCEKINREFTNDK